MKYISILLLAICPLMMRAQLPTADLDVRQGYFDGGNPLPGDTRWRLAGVAPEDAVSVRVEIREKGKLFETADYSKELELARDLRDFQLLMDFPLHTGGRYDFHVVFARHMTAEEAATLQEEVVETCLDYLDRSLISNGNKIRLEEDPRVTFKRLNEILNTRIDPFNEAGWSFSSTLLQHLRDVDGLKLKESRYNLDTQAGMSKRDRRRTYFEQKLKGLKDATRREVKGLLRPGRLVVQSENFINEYPVEKSTFVLPINIGYGAVYNSGGFSDISYATAPYAGVSLPFGTRGMRQKLSLSAGVFLTNFDFGDEGKATGPVIGRPFYGALGIKALRLFRLNLGAAVLETETSSAGGAPVSRVSIKPMLGLSLEINLWAGFGKK